MDALAPRPANKDGAARGPRAALKKLRIDEMTEYEKDFWLEKARIDAILGGARLSMKSLKSGLRCYVAFVGKLCQYALSFFVVRADKLFPETKLYFPPTLKCLLAWSTTFRSSGTLRNYLGYVKTGCIIVNADIRVSSLCQSLATVKT